MSTMSAQTGTERSMADRHTNDSAATLRIEHEAGGAARSLEIGLVEGGCWSGLLGPWAMPGAGALDAMEAFLGSNGAPLSGTVRLHGCASACLLPLLWIKTIWGVGGDVRCSIVWDRVADHEGVRGRQAAGKLACLLADEVVCGDAETALAVWGVEVAPPGDAGTGMGSEGDEAFDLLTNIIDHWDSDLRHRTLASDWNESVRRALLNAAMLGKTRVAIYGAGTHTRAVGEALMEPGVEIVCLIDDDARRHGQRMWGYEIVSREAALAKGLDAVVLSANSIEDLLWERSGVFREAGVTVSRLYG